MPYAITSPDGDHDETIAGVHFTAGRATADDLSPGARLYFGRHSYTVEQLDDDQDDEDSGKGPAGKSPPAPSTSKTKPARAT